VGPGPFLKERGGGGRKKGGGGGGKGGREGGGRINGQTYLEQICLGNVLGLPGQQCGAEEEGIGV